ncbi:MAG TPA: hypothetical protein VN946_24020 [Terriglobales bacterium]|jgi:hypothetical protein|nr:hypothetical protein [Terriglobales bacterium]
MPSHEEKLSFLREDLLDTLKWLFVGAIAWEGAKNRNLCRFDAEKRACSPKLTVMAMYTTLNLARTLYEFFHTENRGGDNARAVDFSTSWDRSARSQVYINYMAPGMPVNKRISHLVYNRALHSGGTGHEGQDHLNKQVVSAAEDILGLTKKFVLMIDDVALRAEAQSALDGALAEADTVAKAYGVTNRFR